MGASTSHTPMCLHGLLQGQLYLPLGFSCLIIFFLSDKYFSELQSRCAQNPPQVRPSLSSGFIKTNYEYSDKWQQVLAFRCNGNHVYWRGVVKLAAAFLQLLLGKAPRAQAKKPVAFLSSVAWHCDKRNKSETLGTKYSNICVKIVIPTCKANRLIQRIIHSRKYIVRQISFETENIFENCRC
jgi:hypothetical protein